KLFHEDLGPFILDHPQAIEQLFESIHMGIGGAESVIKVLEQTLVQGKKVPLPFEFLDRIAFLQHDTLHMGTLDRPSDLCPLGDHGVSTALDRFIGAPQIIGEIQFHHKIDRKSTRLNSSHVKSSYAVFCLKKK